MDNKDRPSDEQVKKVLRSIGEENPTFVFEIDGKEYLDMAGLMRSNGYIK